MSELGTVPKKSLIARFDEYNIIKVAVSEDNPGVLWITYIDDDGKEITRPFSTEGGYAYEIAEVTINNTSAMQVDLIDIYPVADHGLYIGLSVAAGTSETAEVLYYLNEGDQKEWGVNFSNTQGKTAQFVNMTNAHHISGTNFVAINDLTLPSTISVKFE